ncbi:MAG: 5'-methylthioadenosine/adenosylhomocysteine nucleosidase [Clostridia bacterium]|nr:5'-methylthioadenosine/adenosylhomocysteine nucleosidase [Clostridia bacterium]
MKKIFIVVFLAILTLSAFCLVACEQKTDKEYIGIISAMENEIAALVKEAKIDRIDEISGEKYYVGTLKGQNVVITKSGIGKVYAASGSTILLNSYRISKVIFTGIAGGVAEGTNVLDEVIATRLLEHDYGLLSNEGFVWRSGDPGFGNQAGEYYYCDETLVNLAYAKAVEVLGAEHVFKGTVATGDQFIANETYVSMLRQDYDAYACEMEGAAVAKICIANDKPFVVIRALSDKADGKAHDSYANFGDVAADNSCRIVLALLDALPRT